MHNTTCPTCTNGRVTHYRSGFAPTLVRCGACKGTGQVSPAVWLRMFQATPRVMTGRKDAIERACEALGLNRDGSRDVTRYGCETLENGVGGLVADLRAQGFGDVADRLKLAYLMARPFEAEKFEVFVAQVLTARAAS